MWFDNLKQMKKISGKTSLQISMETGIPKSTIDKLFSGQTKEPYLSSTKAIVHCMGFTLDDLENINKQSYNDDEKHIVNNYRSLNHKGKQKLIEYSDDLVSSGNYSEKIHKIKTAARNGSFSETTITDDDINKIMNLPDVDDLK